MGINSNRPQGTNGLESPDFTSELRPASLTGLRNQIYLLRRLLRSLYPGYAQLEPPDVEPTNSHPTDVVTTIVSDSPKAE